MDRSCTHAPQVLIDLEHVRWATCLERAPLEDETLHSVAGGAGVMGQINRLLDHPSNPPTRMEVLTQGQGGFLKSMELSFPWFLGTGGSVSPIGLWTPGVAWCSGDALPSWLATLRESGQVY